MTSFIVSTTPKPTTQKPSRLVSSMLLKTLEEVVAERHKPKNHQANLDQHTKREKNPSKLLVTLLLISFMRMACHRLSSTLEFGRSC
jgi:hypothetical protein